LKRGFGFGLSYVPGSAGQLVRQRGTVRAGQLGQPAIQAGSSWGIAVMPIMTKPAVRRTMGRYKASLPNDAEPHKPFHFDGSWGSQATLGGMGSC
jgi:hypothetical protein